MKNNHFIKYYRVYKNDTAVTEVSVNDFIPVRVKQFKRGLPVNILPDAPSSVLFFQYSLPPGDLMYYGYLSRAIAMEKAKSGALGHINQMIAEVNHGIKKLTQYRKDHYEDLNITLLDANIRRLEKEMNIK